MPRNIYKASQKNTQTFELIQSNRRSQCFIVTTTIQAKFLNGDSLGYAFRVQRLWAKLAHTQGEALFRSLCQYTYLKQSRHKSIDGLKWGGFRAMWLFRPRVRTNGFYVMAREWVNPVTHDMNSTLDPRQNALTSQSFRYFRFFTDGTVAYCLTHSPPDQMSKVLAKRPGRGPQPPPPRVVREGKEKPDVFRGTYSLHQNKVFVAVKSHYNVVNFNMDINHGRQGHFCRLQILNHFSKGLQPNAGMVNHAETTGLNFWFSRAYPSSI